MRQQRHIFEGIDWIMVGLYFHLVFMGWINIYAAVYNEEHQSILDLSQRYGKQLMWIGFATAMAITMLMVDGKFYPAFAYPIYGTVVVTLILVLLFGREVAGSKSWFEVGSFRVQPAEFAKFATCLALSKYLSTLNVNMENLKTKLIATGIIAFPALLILLQNDTGSALVYGSFLLVLYREGLPGNLLVLGLIAVIVFIITLLFDVKTTLIVLVISGIIAYFFSNRKRNDIILIVAAISLFAGMSYSVNYVVEEVLEPHQRNRINVLLGKEDDPHGVGYNVAQSKIAIGSGGLAGKGFLNGTQTKFDFVPEQSTDFIYCTVGEEWGFIGSTLVILLFLALMTRIIFVAERQRSPFSRIYGYGVFAILFFHFAINIGMTIGLAPVIGIPLPFFSYGGSSLWGFTLLLFIFIKLDAHRLYILR